MLSINRQEIILYVSLPPSSATSFSSLLQIENVQFLVLLNPSSLLSWELGVRVVLIIPRLQPPSSLPASPAPGVLRPSFRVLRPAISDLRPLYLNPTPSPTLIALHRVPLSLPPGLSAFLAISLLHFDAPFHWKSAFFRVAKSKF